MRSLKIMEGGWGWRSCPIFVGPWHTLPEAGAGRWDAFFPDERYSRRDTISPIWPFNHRGRIRNLLSERRSQDSRVGPEGDGMYRQKDQR